MNRFLFIAVCLTVLLPLAGCGPGRPREITGLVRFRDRPLPSGTVVFVGADGKKAHSVIGTDGRYRVTGLARGTARVAVKTHPRVPPGLLPRDAPKEPLVVIPERYEKPESSGLSV